MLECRPFTDCAVLIEACRYKKGQPASRVCYVGAACRGLIKQIIAQLNLSLSEQTHTSGCGGKHNDKGK